MNETETAWMYDTTQPRRVVKPQSLLARVMPKDESDLVEAQERLQGLLLDWPDGVVWSIEMK